MMTFCLAVAFLLFMANMQRGRERMHMLRCKRCNAHPWDRHSADCKHNGRW